MTTDAKAPTAPAPSVVAANKAVLGELPFANRDDFADAERGFVASVPDATILNAGGKPAWSQKQYAFIDDGPAPDSVNPSLWRMAQLNRRHGLFKVVDGVYQVRGLDIANMTIVEGKSGIIVIDTLTCVEAARVALKLYFDNRGEKPVKAVIFTHTHADHFAGVKGVVDEADVASGKVPVIAPNLFMEYAVSENVIAGPAMLRRSTYQFGPLLPPGPRGQVDAGLGKTTSRGSASLIAPTDLIMATGDRRTLDGIEFIFQMAPHSEAPAEMHMYVPAYKCLNMAENATHLFHNLLPFRGAEVRDPLAWSKYINEAIELFGAQAESLVGQHHWPTWGNEKIVDYLKKQRDLYKYVHDQTLRLMNHGYTAPEISEEIRLPASLGQAWQNRDYYGSVRHNIKAICQRYLGWYDANPANLNGLPPVEAAKKYVEYMGGAEAVVARARKDFEKGEFRWVAEVMSRVVYADPKNAEARELNAAAFDQLGYMSESATWRNAYLFGAHELRNGPPNISRAPFAADVMSALPVGMFFDSLGVRLNGPKADGKRIVVNWAFTDTGEKYVLNLENSALTWVAGRNAAGADASLALARPTLTKIMTQATTFPEAIGAGLLKIEGNPAKLLELFGLFDQFELRFHIVEP
ncbi:MAG: MBL fold metallo-hydrolase [Hyphomicrobiales bacterium]|nr:MBL fold metallo-hydrolase [Hyphomicrobiales bacterium]